ncbi:MAG: DUF1015 domain-containing protein [Clostridiaceae bacterium]
MAVVKPFKRLRPRTDLAEKVAVLPVDSLDKHKLEEIVDKNQHSFLHVTNPELYNKEITLDEKGKRILNRTSRSFLDGMLEEGILVKDDKPMLFVYKQLIGDAELTGIAGCTAVDDYVNNYIKKHEFTRSEKEKDIGFHIDYCNANTGTIYLIYRWQKDIEDMMQETMKSGPEYDFVTEDGVEHLVWPIADDEKIKKLCRLFEKAGSFYIADGHHRTAAAARVCMEKRKEKPDYTGEEEFNFFLSVLFPDKHLNIMDYNRIIKDLNGLTEEEFMHKVAENFKIENFTGGEPFKPGCCHEFGMYLNGNWYKLTANSNTYDDTHPIKRLDVVVLQNYILDPILNIKDPRTDERIDFVAGVLGLEELEVRADSDMKVAFSVYPCSVSDLMDIADIGEVMPPKSTWFEPKLRSGLFIHSLEEE